MNGFTLAGGRHRRAVVRLRHGAGRQLRLRHAGPAGGRRATCGAMVIAVVMGISAYVALSGPLAALRARLFPFVPHPEAPQGMGAIGWARHPGLRHGPSAGALGLVLILAGGEPAHCAPRSTGRELFWAIAAGSAISSGFLGTAWVANTGVRALAGAIKAHLYRAGGRLDPLRDVLVRAASPISPSARSRGVTDRRLPSAR